MPRISIIIPLFNRAEFVVETFDSVLAQTFADWECVVVDDRSTDDSLAVAQSYADRDSRFKVFVRPPEAIKGAPTCRNIGYVHSCGDLVHWFDSDDLLSPGFFEKVVKVSDENPDAEFFYAELDSFCGDYKPKSYESHDKPPYSGNPFDNLCAWRALPSTPRLIWRRELLDRCNVKWNEGLIKAQDVDFAFRVLSETNNVGAWIPGQPMMHYRRHSHQMLASAQSAQKAEANVEVFTNAFRRLTSKRKISAENQWSFLKGSLKYMFITALVFNSGKAANQFYSFMRSTTTNKSLILCSWLIWKCAPILYATRPITYRLRRISIPRLFSCLITSQKKEKY